MTRKVGVQFRSVAVLQFCRFADSQIHRFRNRCEEYDMQNRVGSR
jgi:hypothetical protein